MTKLNTLLDTLETTEYFFVSKAQEKQYHKGIRKFQVNRKLLSILEHCAEHKKDTYWSTWHCQSVLLQDGSKLIGKLCRKRWCTHCARIKSFELLEAYGPTLQGRELYMVTLTATNKNTRTLEQLCAELDKRQVAFRFIVNLRMRKKHKVQFNAFRKIEVTHNIEKNWYHPHYHVIVEGKKVAELLLKEWQRYFKQTTSKTAQHITPIGTTEKDLLEVFKYATKETTNEGVQYSGDVLDEIYSALQGRRIFQAYGDFKKATPEPMEEQTESVGVDWIPNDVAIYEYDCAVKDWRNEYGKRLVNINP